MRFAIRINYPINMPRKVFISVLGAGLYEKCKYRSGDFCSSETTFVQLATLNYLRNQSSWPSDSRAYILLTEKAKKENWIVESNQRYHNQKNEYVSYVGLKTALEGASLGFSFEGVSIPDGKDENEMWEIFETLYNLLEESDELYFDLTHSFRYLPMLVLVLGNYAKFLKSAKVCSITYGNYEARDPETNVAPIVDLLPLSSLQDWTFATADFLENGHADRLVALSDKSLDPLMRNEETRTDDTKRLRSFVNNLKNYSLELQTCRGLDIINASTIEKVKSDINALHTIVIPQIQPVLEKVQSSVDRFQVSGEVMNAFKAAQLCYENQQYQQATTFLEEGIISFFCQRHGIKLEDRNKRELVTSALFITKLGVPREEWKVDNEGLYGLLEEILRDPMMKDGTLLRTFLSCAELRNDYNHCGMRQSILKPQKIKERIKQQLDTIIPLIEASKSNGEPKELPSLLVNFSNHPLASWEDEQIKAAKEYGELVDVPFPAIDPEADEKHIESLADQYTEQLLTYAKDYRLTVHIMGEMTFVYRVVSLLIEQGVTCIASTTERDAEITNDGRKISDFQFVKFRRY